MGVAKGVIYLHQDSGLKIIHRGLKPTNILLDIEMNPKISGLGITRTFEEHQSTKADSRVVGTLGYISPEYAIQKRLSDKSDVYSFGVIVLEILSGKKHTGYPRYDLDLIKYLWNEGKALDLVDKSNRGAFSEDEALRCIQVGLSCTQYEPHHRPTMPSVLEMLLGEELSLQEKITEAASHKANIECDGAFNLENAYRIIISCFQNF
ncbi:hypothetical protein Pfo_019277 [Paulownia fortunei]|nr:hypothetical protein Pfo_019277 [Paulownia fortunei]